MKYFTNVVLIKGSVEQFITFSTIVQKVSVHCIVFSGKSAS
jgi:hypothetical protein